MPHNLFSVRNLTKVRSREGRSFIFWLLTVLAMVVVAGCAGGEAPDASAPEAEADEAAPEADDAEPGQPETLRVAVVTPGPVSDQGYNAAAVRGLEMAEEEWGIETAISENVAPGAEAAQVIRGYAADGFDVIIGHGEPYQGPIEEIAGDFPDTKFFIHAGDLEGVPNVASSYLAVEEGSYLEGIIAGHLTDTGRIGFVGFTPIDLIIRAMNGVELGAQTVNEAATVDSVFTNNLVDPAVAREATNALIANGADVIVHINGGTNTPDIFSAAEEAGIKAMGWPVDQSGLAPETIATSLLANYPLLIMSEIEAVMNDAFESGIVEYGLESGVIGIAPIADWVPQEAVDAVEDARQRIMSGELQIDVPGEIDET